MQEVKFMPINSKTTKAQIVEYAKRLERAVNAYREGHYENQPQWFGVAPYGWGSWEEDVCFVEACTPKEALEKAEQEFKNDIWYPNTWDWAESDRSNPFAGRVFVYNIVEIGTYEKVVQLVEWAKTA